MCLSRVTVLAAFVLIDLLRTLTAAKIEFASDKEATWEEAVLSLHNHPRLAAGLPAFQWNNALAGVAREWLQSDAMSSRCDTSNVAHSSKDFRTKHPASPFYYLGETAVSKELHLGELKARTEPWNAVQLAKEAASRWGRSNISYGRWGSACTVGKVHTALPVLSDQNPGTAKLMAAAAGRFQSLWADTREVGCEAAFCGQHGNENWKTFLFLCEYGPGGNILGELPFSPTTASILGLSSSPCDGPLSDSELTYWERWDTKNYPLPASDAGDWRRPLHTVVLFLLLMHVSTYREA